MISYGFPDFLGRIDPEKWIWEGYPTSNQPLPNIGAPTFRTETDDLESHEIQKAKSQKDQTYPWVNEETGRRVLKNISKVFIPLRPVLENWLLQSMERNQFRSALHQVSSHVKLSNILYVRGLCRVERLCDLMPVTVCLGKPSNL